MGFDKRNLDPTLAAAQGQDAAKPVQRDRRTGHRLSAADRKKPSPTRTRDIPRKRLEERRRVFNPIEFDRPEVPKRQTPRLPLVIALLLGAAGGYIHYSAQRVDPPTHSARLATATRKVRLPPGPTAPSAASRVTPTRDGEGRLTRLVGRSPGDVLEAFCSEVTTDAPCEASRIADAEPFRNGLKVGVMEIGSDFSDDKLEQVIWIRRNGRGDWFSGDGLKPLEAQPLR